MPNVTINGKQITVPRGTPILRAAAMLGFNIPHFCYHPALSAPANCRMCLVEVEKARKLEPACYLKVTDGMVVHTDNPKVQAARRAVLEFILVNHPVDCPICDQAGECKLQDYYMAYDARPSRLTTKKNGKAKAYPIGPHVVYDGERCILCTRCVRFCDEVTGTSELTVVERGDRSEIRTFPGRELDNDYSMNVTDICPVGALTTRDFRFKCRVWLMSSTDSICTGCARGCNVHLEHFQGTTQRYRPRFNPDVNEYWMCDPGRLSYKALHTDRISDIRIDQETTDAWPRAARRLGATLTAKLGDGAGLAFVVSAQMSCESLYAAQQFQRTFLPQARVFWTGAADGKADAFLQRADRNPNRAGVAALFGHDVMERDGAALLAALEDGSVQALWLMGSQLPLDAASRTRFVEAARGTSLFILQAAHAADLASAAHVVLPAATHAEGDGTYINDDGRAQLARAAFSPVGAALPDWEIFVRLSRGLDRPLAQTALSAIQAEIFESAAAAGQ